MPRKAVRTVLIVLAVLGALVAIVGAGVYLNTSEPVGDMRQRADALPLAQDFVLVSESYSEGALGLFGSVPHLNRVYHAAWPGLCDTLQNIAGRLGGPTGLARVPQQYADRMCNVGAWYGSGWGGRIRNYRHYEVRLTARSPEFAHAVVLDYPIGFWVLYPKPGGRADAKIDIPEGRARVDVDLIAHRGR